jgi:hypothetical protein
MQSCNRPLGLFEDSLRPHRTIHFPLGEAQQRICCGDGHEDAGVQDYCEALHRYLSAEGTTSERASLSAAATSSGEWVES